MRLGIGKCNLDYNPYRKFVQFGDLVFDSETIIENARYSVNTKLNQQATVGETVLMLDLREKNNSLKKETYLYKPHLIIGFTEKKIENLSKTGFLIIC